LAYHTTGHFQRTSKNGYELSIKIAKLRISEKGAFEKQRPDQRIQHLW